jgi:ankyrin repeat protein
MDTPPPPQDDDPIIALFKPVGGDQWELNNENIKRIDHKTGETILHNYCKKINATPLAVFQYLIEAKGCDVNVEDKHKHVPVHQALIHFSPDENGGGNIAALMYLLSQTNVKDDIKGQVGYTLLHAACYNINSLPIDIFKVLVEKIDLDVNAMDENQDTPLHFAFELFNPEHGGDSKVLIYLLNQESVNVNLTGCNGDIALHTACININKLPIEVFKVLVETHGADINAQDDDHNTPFICALIHFDPDDGGNITTLTYLLSHMNVNVSIMDKFGCTLLHWACKRINYLPLDVFQYLIEKHGCDVNTPNNFGNTPLHDALENFDPNNGGDINVLAYLINQNNVNANTKNKNGYTLLHSACMVDLSNRWHFAELDAKCDTNLSLTIEIIAERCIQQILDGTTS